MSVERREPLIHSHITDGLPNDHALAFEQVSCTACGDLVHAANNECMTTWIETGRGNYCVPCFVAAIAQPIAPAMVNGETTGGGWISYVLDDDLGLPT